MNNWKPGDVGSIPFGRGNEVGLYTEEGWVTPCDVRYPNKDYTDVRPLVVIDPDSPEDMSRLVGLMPWRPTLYRELQDALREFAAPTPPRPDEPQGLGAVVEDADGKFFIRVDREHIDGRLCWRDQQGTFSPWLQINAVRVLSEGVTA